MGGELKIENKSRSLLLGCFGMVGVILLVMAVFPYDASWLEGPIRGLFGCLAAFMAWNFLLVRGHRTYLATSDQGVAVNYPVPVVIPWAGIRGLEMYDGQRQRPGYDDRKQTIVRIHLRPNATLGYGSAPLAWYGRLAYRSGFVPLRPHIFEPWDAKDLFQALIDRRQLAIPENGQKNAPQPGFEDAGDGAK